MLSLESSTPGRRRHQQPRVANLGHSYLLGELLLQVRIWRVRIGDWLARLLVLQPAIRGYN